MAIEDLETRFAPIERKMRLAGLPDIAIRSFRHYYAQLLDGTSGLLGEDRIGPVESVRDKADLIKLTDAGRAALARCLIIKLNGGLGTSMGLNQAKSLLPARDNISFLALIAQQTLHLRADSGQTIPLLLMNSFHTESDSLAHLAHLPELAGGQAPLPLSFLQHRVPRLATDTLQPISWPQAPQREWCPPGHGDLYTALAASGLLAQLRSAGYRYAFVSNADNLGATLDLDILGLIASERIPFLMEVTDRTTADRKGGHLAQDREGRLVLRELAQCPPEEAARFQDIDRYRYFNTNNLWLDLQALEDELSRRDGVLGLPMIRNFKHVVPEDPDTPRVIQIETAMGAAIEVFDGARILRVPRTRFAPVKTTGDLLALWSDCYRREPDGRVVPEREQIPDIRLDPSYYAAIEDFRARFRDGAPSLRAANRLELNGDIRFEAEVVIRGSVRLINREKRQRVIAAGSVLQDIDEG